jgi:hypothetical protein
MHPDIHRAALRAAAKLALTIAPPALALACSSSPVSRSNSTSQSEDTTSDDASSQAASDDSSAPACVVDYCYYQESYETVQQCCQDEVANADFPTPPHVGPDADPRVDDLTQGCCTVLAKAAGNTFEWPQRSQCCGAIGWQAAFTCTPWGPPVPPAMPRGGALA